MSAGWESRRWLVLTGAGVSTDSGIPDYRGPDAPPRTPKTYQEFIASASARQRYWARAHVGWTHMRAAEPNATHHDLARRQRDGQLLGLITQNVDGLHQRAGSIGTIDLHGRLDRVLCLDCGETTRRDQLHRRLRDANPGWTTRTVEVAPDGDVVIDDTGSFVVTPCLRCGGRLKPDVVFFGETVPKPRVQRCFDLVEQARDEDAVLLVLGSSLQVMSGLRFVKRAAKDGVAIVIVNRGPTRGDNLATLKLDAGVAETLAALPHRLSA